LILLTLVIIVNIYRIIKIYFLSKNIKMIYVLLRLLIIKFILFAGYVANPTLYICDTKLNQVVYSALKETAVNSNVDIDTVAKVVCISGIILSVGAVMYGIHYYSNHRLGKFYRYNSEDGGRTLSFRYRKHHSIQEINVNLDHGFMPVYEGLYHDVDLLRRAAWSTSTFPDKWRAALAQEPGVLGRVSRRIFNQVPLDVFLNVMCDSIAFSAAFNATPIFLVNMLNNVSELFLSDEGSYYNIINVVNIIAEVVDDVSNVMDREVPYFAENNNNGVEYK